MAIRLKLNLLSIPLHRGPKFTRVPSSDPADSSCALEQRLEARLAWDKELCWSFCLDARPGSYSGGRETTPVGLELPMQHKRETVPQQKGYSALQLSPTAHSSIPTPHRLLEL